MEKPASQHHAWEVGKGMQVDGMKLSKHCASPLLPKFCTLFIYFHRYLPHPTFFLSLAGSLRQT